MQRMRRLLPRELLDLASGLKQPLRLFEDYFEAGSRPCLLLGEMKHWPAVRRWRPPWNYMDDLLGPETVVDVAALPPGGRLTGSTGQQYLSMSFSDFLLFDGTNNRRVEQSRKARLDSLPRPKPDSL